PSTDTACTYGGLNGPRWLILQQSNGQVGVGVSGLTVGDFGAPATPAKIPSGAHYPRQAELIEAWANWYDTAPPQSADLNVEGNCFDMTLERGTAQNGAYRALIDG